MENSQVNPQNRFAIYSPSEAAAGDCDGFWSNEYGWLNFCDATWFMESELTELHLPLSAGDDARWVGYEEATKLTAMDPAGDEDVRPKI